MPRRKKLLPPKPLPLLKLPLLPPKLLLLKLPPRLLMPLLRPLTLPPRPLTLPPRPLTLPRLLLRPSNQTLKGLMKKGCFGTLFYCLSPVHPKRESHVLLPLQFRKGVFGVLCPHPG
ncbi:MAG: hypothetical protein K0R03_790 [Moraxellaceae bacterium]|nr:hypothetical protein [Moraxellaceae bacterium]